MSWEEQTDSQPDRDDQANGDPAEADLNDAPVEDQAGSMRPGVWRPMDSAPVDARTTDRLFAEAVEAHSKRLLAIARAIIGTRASAEDVVQQAFTNLYQHRHRYDWREPGGLLRRTVVNEALRILRQPRVVALADETGGPGPDQSPVGEMIENETVQQVRRAIAKLPEHFRAALVLCEYENMPYAQIATTLGASVAQVKTWIFRGRRQLAQMLEPYAQGRK